MSYTSMNLHYSQTGVGPECSDKSLIPLWIYITLKLGERFIISFPVLYLYEFTLLSNKPKSHRVRNGVLYLYEFTLLSNIPIDQDKEFVVLYLYEFTLLSNIPIDQDKEFVVLYLYEFTLLSNVV